MFFPSKVKGEANNSSSTGSDDDTTMTLKIRTSDGAEIDCVVPAEGLVGDLQDRISKLLQLDESNYLRLIYCGRMLSPPTAALSSFKIHNGSFIHSVVSNKSARVSESPSNTTTGNSNDNRNTSAPLPSFPTAEEMPMLRGLDTLMLPPGYGDPDLNNRNNNQRATSRSRRTIRQSAIGREDVASIRSYFSDDVAAYVLEHHLQPEPGEDEAAFNLRAESAWMEAQGPHSEFRLNLQARSLISSVNAMHGGIHNGVQFNYLPGLAALFGVPLDGSGRGHGAIGTLSAQSTASEYNDRSGRNLRSSHDDAIRPVMSVTEFDFSSLREFLFGFLMGSTLGFMMIFCVWDRNVTHKQKLGIIAGIMVQMLLGSMQQEQQTRHSVTSSPSSSTSLTTVHSFPSATDGVALQPPSTTTVPVVVTEVLSPMSSSANSEA